MMISSLLYGVLQFLQVSLIALRIMSFAPEGNETQHQHKAAAVAGQIQTQPFITCQIPPLNVGVVQAGAWTYDRKVRH